MIEEPRKIAKFIGVQGKQIVVIFSRGIEQAAFISIRGGVQVSKGEKVRVRSIAAVHLFFGEDLAQVQPDESPLRDITGGTHTL